MLRSISWKQFIEWMAWASVIYYLWVGLRFYRRDILALLTGSRVKNPPANAPPPASAPPTPTADRTADGQAKSDGNNKTKKI